MGDQTEHLLPGLPQTFCAMIKRDFQCAFRRLNQLVLPLAFFIIVASLFPLAIDPAPAFLAKIAPGVIWIAALLSTLLMVDGMFQEDFDNGSLEILAISGTPLGWLVLARVTGYWMLSGIPLLLVSLLLGAMLNLPSHAFPVAVASLLLGTPVLHLVGAIGAALTLNAGNRGGLVSLIVLPLYVPVLIFGSSAISSSMLELPVHGQLLFVAALLALALSTAPLAIAAALRIALD